MEVEVGKGRKKIVMEIIMNANEVERKRIVQNLEGNDLTVRNRVRVQEDMGRKGIEKGKVGIGTILVALLEAEVGVLIERGVTGTDGQEVVVMIINEVVVLIEKIEGPENYTAMSTEIRKNTHHHLKQKEMKNIWIHTEEEKRNNMV